MPTTLRNTDILFNDGSTQNTALSTTSVLNATAAASVGAVGTYAWLRPTATTHYTEGTTLAGSAMRYNGAAITTTSAVIAVDGGTPAGTWRAMGRKQADILTSLYTTAPTANFGTLWLRIS